MNHCHSKNNLSIMTGENEGGSFVWVDIRMKELSPEGFIEVFILL